MYLFDLERERDSSLLVDFDYEHNLFEYEENSASLVLKGDGCGDGESLPVAKQHFVVCTDIIKKCRFSG